MADKCSKLPHTTDPPTCPINGLQTRPVARATIEALVRDDLTDELTPQPYYFCDAPTCDTVYVSALGDHIVAKDELKVRVGIKETEDPVPLCYCFGYDRKLIRDDIRARGDTDIQRVVTERVRAGDCTCEVTNPSGGCCLGELSRAIKEARALKDKGLL